VTSTGTRSGQSGFECCAVHGQAEPGPSERGVNGCCPDGGVRGLLGRVQPVDQVLEVGQHPLAQFVGAACSVVTPQRRSTSLHAMPRSWQRRRSSGNTA
jgi:hypothetical protein